MNSFLKALLMLCLSLMLFGGQVRSQHPKENSKYSNELPGFKFFQESKWKSLVPLESTMADVRRVLGKPKREHDVSRYTKPYPGDADAKQPVFAYDYDERWQILVYFVKYCFNERAKLPENFGDRLCSIELIPKTRMPFEGVAFPAAFIKKHITAVDAAWDEYADGSGLVYEIYTTRTRYGDSRPGDLNRIKYGPSDEELRKYASK